MNTQLVIALTASALLFAACQETPSTAADTEAETSSLSTFEQRFSYALGTNVGNQFKRDELAIDVDSLAMALRDVRAGNPPQMSEEDIRSIMVEAQEKQQAKQQATQSAQAETNKADGETFLTANAAKEGVVSLESGLQYKIVTPGTGAKPRSSDTVTVHYRGTLLDGTEFDSSYSRGEPASFPVTGVIAGWTEALQLMKEGAKWELYIPSDLAYGAHGPGGVIGPNATLVFEVELLSAGSSK